ncbi:MAG TPA: arginine N-succinyltransferase [Tepidisphaeraceae bacterium]|jgi:arginine N-succinyltransferase|nr:arginine N-succinyltransferase [Tepidisphaeraceae bacterium]
MLVVRPAMLDDLDQVVALAARTGHGLTTLPRDPQILRRRIVESTRAFDKLADEHPHGETYLFVLEDLKNRKIVGTSGILSKVGGFEPFYAYRIEIAHHESKALGVKKDIPVLKLVADHNGPSEICSLFLLPELRHGGNGRLLSLMRFLFMAEFPTMFDQTVLAELRGVIDETGGAPFWESVGRHFFDVDFDKADYQSMVDKRFIADLMPVHPIYIPLLPRSAQEVIGQVHPHSRPALAILETEGFTFANMIDIFDGGPIVTCPLKNIRTVRESKSGKIGRVIAEEMSGGTHLVGNSNRLFRVCQSSLAELPDGTVMIPDRTAAMLGVRAGDTVRYLPMPMPLTNEHFANVRAPQEATVLRSK